MGKGWLLQPASEGGSPGYFCPAGWWNWPSRANSAFLEVGRERGGGKREGLLADDNWEAPPLPSTPFPKKNIAALWLLMASRWSNSGAKRGELSWGWWLTWGDERLDILPLSARTRWGGGKGHASVRKAKGRWRKPQTTPSGAQSRTRDDSTQRCHGQVSSAYPGNTGRRLEFCNVSVPARAGRRSAAHLQDWDGRWWSRSGTGDPGWNMPAHPSAAPADTTSGHLYVPWDLSC